MYTPEIPALRGEIGELTVRSGNSVGEQQQFPARPILNSDGRPVAWLRHIFPNATLIEADLRYGRLQKGGLAEQVTTATFESDILKPLQAGKQHEFTDKLSILESYGLQVAPRWDVIATVSGTPSLLRLTPHIEGTPFLDWLIDNAVPTEVKHTRVVEHVTRLSAYARDTAIEQLNGRTCNDAPLFFDISSTEQCLVTPQHEVVLIDTGDESAIGYPLDWGLYLFHDRLITPELVPYVDEKAITTLKDDLEAVRVAFWKVGRAGTVIDTIGLERKALIAAFS